MDELYYNKYTKYKYKYFKLLLKFKYEKYSFVNINDNNINKLIMTDTEKYKINYINTYLNKYKSKYLIHHISNSRKKLSKIPLKLITFPNIRRTRSPNIQRTRSPNIRRNRSPNIRRNRSPNIRRNRSPNIRRHRSPNIRRNRSPNIRRHRSSNIRRNRSPNIRRNNSSNIRRNRSPNIRRNRSSNIRRNSSNNQRTITPIIHLQKPTDHLNQPVQFSQPQQNAAQNISPTRIPLSEIIKITSTAKPYSNLDNYKQIIKEDTTIDSIEKNIHNNYNIHTISNIDFQTIKFDKYDIDIIKNISIQDYITTLDGNSTIGLCIAGNSGRPGGGITKDNINLKDLPKKGLPQEESILYDWFQMDSFSENIKIAQDLYNKSIKNRWGLFMSNGNMTIQGHDYTKKYNNIMIYFLVYSVYTYYMNKKNVYLLFTFSPNTNEGRTLTGSMTRTIDPQMTNTIDGLRLYVKGLIAALSATILCAINNNIEFLLLPLVGCNVNAYEEKITGGYTFSFRDFLSNNYDKFVKIALNNMLSILKNPQSTLKIIIFDMKGEIGQKK